MRLLLDRDADFGLHTVGAMKSRLSNVIFSHQISASLVAQPSGK